MATEPGPPSKTGQFQPGAAWAGNRRGRPKKGSAVAELLRYVGDLQYHDAGLTYRERAAELVWELACQGHLDALKWIVERTEGTAPQRVEHSGPGGGPMEQRHEVEIRAVGYRNSIRALAPVEREELPG